MPEMLPIIAIDGPAGSGKSTVARAVADEMDFQYLDSGAMYRCLALAADRTDTDPSDGDALAGLLEKLRIELEPGDIVRLDGEDVTRDIRAASISALTSRVSVHEGVRSGMVARQRELLQQGGYVAEGRDIGTVVAPGAQLKIYLTASDVVRASRRAAQTGDSAERVLGEQRRRDERDRDREHAPLRPANDAIELDSTGLGIDEVVARIVDLAADHGLRGRG